VNDVYFERLSAREYRAIEKRGSGKVISFITMCSDKHMLSDVRRVYAKLNRIKGVVK